VTKILFRYAAVAIQKISRFATVRIEKPALMTQALTHQLNNGTG
jgi:hypothetical protein